MKETYLRTVSYKKWAIITSCILIWLVQNYYERILECKWPKYFNNRTDIELGVPQGSVLRPLLFNVDIIDLFYECDGSNVASYVDDTIPYSSAKDKPSVALELQASATRLFHQFQNKPFKP